MSDDAISFKLACGAEVTVRVVVDAANCRERDGACMTAREIAALLWMAVHDPELAPTSTEP